MSKRKYSPEQLIEAVKTSYSYREVARKLGFKKGGSHIAKIINTEYGLDTSHFVKSFPGSSKYLSWIGKKQGKLTIVEIFPPDKSIKRRHYSFLCKCECGNFRIYTGVYFQREISRSCGCDKEYIYRHRGMNGKCSKGGYGDIWESYLSRIKSRSSDRNQEYDLDAKYLWELFLSQDKKCALSGINITIDCKTSKNNTASLDRIDSNKGYTKGNVQWVHKDINRIKSNFDEKTFIHYCDCVHKHNIDKKNKCE